MDVHGRRTDSLTLGCTVRLGSGAKPGRSQHSLRGRGQGHVPRLGRRGHRPQAELELALLLRRAPSARCGIARVSRGIWAVENPEVCYYFEFIQITNVLTSSDMSEHNFVVIFRVSWPLSAERASHPGKQENDEGFRSYAPGIVAVGDEVG